MYQVNQNPQQAPGQNAKPFSFGAQAPNKPSRGPDTGFSAFPEGSMAMGRASAPGSFGANWSEVGPGVKTDGQYNYQPRFGSYTQSGEEGAQPQGVGPQIGWDRTPGGRSTFAGDTISELDMEGNQTGQRSEYRNTLAGDLAKFGLMATGINGVGNFLTGASSAGAAGAAGVDPNFLAANAPVGNPGGLAAYQAAAGGAAPAAAAGGGGGGIMDTARQVGSAIKTGADAVGGIGRVAGAIGGAAIANRGAGEVGTSGEFTQAAEQQGAENFRTNEYNLNRNRFDTNTPIGSTTWTRVADPNAPGGFRDVQNTNMSPEERSIYDTRVSNQNQAGAMAGDLAGQMRSTFQQPFSLDGIPGTERAAGFQGPIATPQGAPGILAPGTVQQSRLNPQAGRMSAPEMVGNAGALQQQDMSGAQSPEFQRAQREGLPQARDLFGQTGYESSRGRVEQAQFDRMSRLMDPQLQRAEAALDTQLRNQGLMPGTEGYDNAMNDLRQTQAMQRADAIDRSIISGGQEQSRLAGLDLAADNQRFGQQRSIYQDMFGELDYNNDLTGRESDTTWNRNLQGNEFNRASQQGNFNNLRAAIGDRNAAQRGFQQDQFGRDMDVASFNNQAGRDEFDMDLAGANFRAGENQRTFGREMDSFRTGYDTAFGLGTERRANAGFNNQVRTQDINERLLPRNQSINEFTSLAGFGRDAQMPQAPAAGLSNLRPTDYQGAADSNYTRNVDNQNARTSRDQQLLNFFSQLFGWN